MSCISPWDNSRGGRDVVQTVLLPVSNIALEISMTRDVGSVVIRDAGCSVFTGQYSNFWGRLSLP